MERPTCKTCPFFDVFRDRSQGGLDAGVCRANPLQTPTKYASEWCGEHPAFPEYVETWRRNHLT